MQRTKGWLLLVAVFGALGASLWPALRPAPALASVIHPRVTEFVLAQAVTGGGCNAAATCTAAHFTTAGNLTVSSTTGTNTISSNTNFSSAAGPTLQVRLTGSQVFSFAAATNYGLFAPSTQTTLAISYLRAAPSTTENLSIGYGRNSAGTTNQTDTYSATSGNQSHVDFRSSWAPASGSLTGVGVQIRPTVNGVSSASHTSLAIAPVTNTWTGGTQWLLDMGTTTTDYFTGFTRKLAVDTNGKQTFTTTDTTGDTDGTVTANTVSGLAIIPATASSVTVNNSLVSASSRCFAVLQTNDATLINIRSCIPASGSFVIHGTAGATATANTTVAFWVHN